MLVRVRASGTLRLLIEISSKCVMEEVLITVSVSCYNKLSGNECVVLYILIFIYFFIFISECAR